MKIGQGATILSIPDRLRDQLKAFQARVWRIKMSEAILATLFASLASFLISFGLDRVIETPPWVRLSLLAVVFLGVFLFIPLNFHRWVLSLRKPEDLSRLLAKKDPAFGDRLLGVIELADNRDEQGHSVQLCQAAIEQVDEDAKGRDFTLAAPTPRILRWGSLAGGVAALTVAGALTIPDAMSNAFQRWLDPFGGVPRYTFAQLGDLPDSYVVAAGEPFVFEVPLATRSKWYPDQATLELDDTHVYEASLADGLYRFRIPSQLDSMSMKVVAGDDRQTLTLEPVNRPSALNIQATIDLPEYLERPEPQSRTLRSGGLAVLQGSDLDLAVEVNRELSQATKDGESVAFEGSVIRQRLQDVQTAESFEWNWVDHHNLEAAKPLSMTIQAREDGAPSLSIEGLSREIVLLETDTREFKVRAQDDYGIKEIGMVWEGQGHPELGSEPAQGEKQLSLGGPEETSVESDGAFGGRWLGIEPQVLQMRLYTVDYLPNRERVYSPPYTVFLLSPDEHKRWLTEQLSLWHKQALEVRDRERQLYEANKEIRGLAAEVLDKPEVRERIEAQAKAEQANGNRLSQLTQAGDMLVSEAVKNDEFGVGTLEKWAETLQVLEDIAGNRMPSVADLLNQASDAAPGESQPSESLASTESSPGDPSDSNEGEDKQAKPGEGGNSPKSDKSPPKVIVDRSDQEGSGASSKSEDEDDKAPPAIPGVQDVESRFGDDDPKEESEEQPPSTSTPRLTLPQTTIMGGGPKDDKPASCPAGEKMDEAVEEQEDLLEEFEKISDELEQILRDLENSTFVKRLKAQARLQRNVADDLSESMVSAFGAPRQKLDQDERELLTELGDREAMSAQKLSVIQQDMRAYQERRKEVKYQKVLTEMQDQRLIASLETLGEEIPKRLGIGVSHSEYWADTLDRWAEELVGPG